MFSEALLSLARNIIAEAREDKLHITAAESCTGGLIAALLTEIPGSSDVFERGFVTYSNRAKEEMLGVPAALTQSYGAVSEQVVRAMAAGALERASVDLAVAVTGIAGPGGSSVQKPIGLVHIAAMRKSSEMLHKEFHFGDIGRGAVRIKSVEAALELLRALPR